jgi:hypothetical protein
MAHFRMASPKAEALLPQLATANDGSYGHVMGVSLIAALISTAASVISVPIATLQLRQG